MKFKLLFALLLTLLSNDAFAGVESQGKVKNIFAIGGYVKFTICTTSTNCRTFHTKPDSEFNKMMVTLLLTARATDKIVWVGGRDAKGTSWPIQGAHEAYAVDFKG